MGRAELPAFQVGPGRRNRKPGTDRIYEDLLENDGRYTHNPLGKSTATLGSSPDEDLLTHRGGDDEVVIQPKLANDEQSGQSAAETSSCQLPSGPLLRPAQRPSPSHRIGSTNRATVVTKAIANMHWLTTKTRVRYAFAESSAMIVYHV